MTKRGNFQCLAPANHFCSGGILFFLLTWATFAILVVTVLGLENKLSACNMRCYSPTFCWQSITLTPPSMCAGDATKCFNKCPKIVGSLTIIDGSLECRQVNQCDEINLEENEKVNECTSVCTLENKVVKVPIAFSLVCFYFCSWELFHSTSTESPSDVLSIVPDDHGIGRCQVGFSCMVVCL